MCGGAYQGDSEANRQVIMLHNHALRIFFDFSRWQFAIHLKSTFDALNTRNKGALQPEV